MNSMQILVKLSQLTQKQFADAVGIDQQTVSYQCKKGVNIERFFEYCEKVNVDPVEIIKYRKQLNKDNG